MSNCRVIGKSENSGVTVLFGGHNLPTLVEIGLTDLPKSGDAMAPLAPPMDDTPVIQIVFSYILRIYPLLLSSLSNSISSVYILQELP